MEQYAEEMEEGDRLKIDGVSLLMVILEAEEITSIALRFRWASIRPRPVIGGGAVLRLFIENLQGQEEKEDL